MKKTAVSTAFLVSIFVLPLFVPAQTHAQTGTALCWTKDRCLEERANKGIAADKLEDGFYQSNETIQTCGVEKNADNEDIGYCLPSFAADTRINFGGRTSFRNVGDFIAYMYRYGIIIASVLAVIMIIFGGLQWTISGSSPERVTSAKKRIGGALLGLTIAIASYTLLNTINPGLLALRLPNVWMINTVGIVAPNCTQIDKPISTVPASNEQLKTQETAAKAAIAATYQESTSKNAEAVCGNEYYVKGANGQTCSGNVCPANEACTPYDVDAVAGNPTQTGPACSAGDIVVRYRLASLKQAVLQNIGAPTGLFTNETEEEWLDGNAYTFLSVCEYTDVTGKTGLYVGKEVSAKHKTPIVEFPGTPKEYIVQYFIEDNSIANACKLKGGRNLNSINGSFVGMFLVAELTKQWSWKDPNITVGQKTPDLSSAAVGGWKKSVTFANYITWDKDSPGRFLDAIISEKVIGETFESGIANPTTLSGLTLAPVDASGQPCTSVLVNKECVLKYILDK